MTNYQPWFIENFRDFFVSHEAIMKIVNQYKNRPYHNLKHIYDMIQFVDKNYRIGNFLLTSDVHYWSMIFAIIYHDIVYCPGDTLNEEKSAAMFVDDYYNGSIIANNINPDLVIRFIMATKHHDSTDIYDQVIIQADLARLRYGSFNDLLSDEKSLFKEFQKYDVNTYRDGRVKFLDSFYYKDTNINIPQYINYIKNKQYSIGIYCGSFNPMHIGHLDVLKKAEDIFDKVIVARGINGQKEKTIPYNMPSLPNQTIEYSNVFKMIKSIKDNNSNCNIHIVRGIRNEYDLHTEDSFRKWIHSFDSNIKFVYLSCNSNYEHISSSSLRELQNIGEDISKYLVKDYV